VNPEDREDFERLYRRHRAEIYRYLLRALGNREDADDATQDAFLSAFGAIERNGPPRNPRPWLYAIADNLRRRWWVRGRERPRLVSLDAAAEHAAPERERTPAEVARALDELPRRQAQVLAGREIAGLSYAELADRLDLSEPAVQMLLFRARRRIRGALAWLPFGADPLLRAATVVGVAAIGTGVVATSGDVPAPAAAHARAHAPAPVRVDRARDVQVASAPARDRVSKVERSRLVAPPPAAAPETQTVSAPSGAAAGSAAPAAATSPAPAPSSSSPVGVVAATLVDQSVVSSPVTVPALAVAAPELPVDPSSLSQQVTVPSLGK
jgi:RNA polymerase sigma-70 factor (ECF subfamily)